MTSIIDQLSRTKTKEEIAEQKRARAQTLDKSKSNDVAPAASSTTAEVSRAVPTTTELSGGRDPSQTTATSMTASTAPSAATSTTTATDTGTAAGVAKPKPRHPDDDRPSMRLAPKSTRIQERSCSPGTMPDGSHSKCSGERGESYVPPTGLGKLAGKLRGH